mmetsp:Transcript_15966/g.28315  ORF Transcript_15966/g.28315 Transcript_15966/m.28315 type:complete len:497 (-) Transcript_15966:482-1972(-)
MMRHKHQTAAVVLLLGCCIFVYLALHGYCLIKVDRLQDAHNDAISIIKKKIRNFTRQNQEMQGKLASLEEQLVSAEEHLQQTKQLNAALKQQLTAEKEKLQHMNEARIYRNEGVNTFQTSGYASSLRRQDDMVSGAEVPPPPKFNPLPADGPTHAIVVFTYSRHQMLQRTLDDLFSTLEHSDNFIVYVSQDGMDYPMVTQQIEAYGSKVRHLINRRNITGITEKERHHHYQSYYAIAHHYKWAIDTIFKEPRLQRIIVLEEDLQLAPDVFDYFLATSNFFDEDSTLYAVSAWNDNGKSKHVHDPERLYLSDFFPGLGWMTSRQIWMELSAKWTLGFWDDWMRQPAQRKMRTCIRPEISRSYTIGDRGGASAGQFYNEHLKPIKLNTVPVKWSRIDLSYLKSEAYARKFAKEIVQAEELSGIHEIQAHHDMGDNIKVQYNSREEFVRIAKKLSLMSDFKDGVPRTAYKGVVTFRAGSTVVHLVPGPGAKLYEYASVE